MTPTETVSRLRRLADDWRKEEKQLCEQFGSEIIPRSMRARRIKDTKAIDAAVEMIETMKQQERVTSAQPAPSIRPAALFPVIAWLRNGCDPMKAADELEMLAAAPGAKS